MASGVAALVSHLIDEVLQNLSSLPDNMTALLDLLQGQRLLSAPQITMDLHKQWNQRVLAAVRHKQTPVRCCGLALVEVTLASALPLGNEAELINPWSIELPDIFRRAISPVEVEAAAAALHAVTTAAIHNAEAKRELLTAHLPKVMAALQNRLEADGDRVQSTVVSHIALFLRALKASARPYISKLENVSRTLLAHNDLSVRDAAAHLLVATTPCTADDTWTPLAARVTLTLELLMDALTVPEEDESIAADKQAREQRSGSSLFSDAPKSDSHSVLQRSETCVRLLQALLESTEAGSVSFPLRDLLRLVARVLNWRVNAAATDELFTLSLSIPRSQAIMLRLLKVLMRRVGHKLYRDAEVIFMLLTRLLGLSNLGCPTYLLMAVLATLREYLAVFGASSAQFIAPLAATMREQLSPARAGTISSATSSGGAQRKRKKATAQEVATSTALRAQEAEKLYSHVDLLVARLKTLHSLLLHAGSVLPRKHRIDIDQVVLVLLGRTVAEKSLLPYSSPSFRLHLYQALHASLLSPLDHQSPLLPYALHYFTAGQQDPVRSVAEFCTQGAAVCAARVNPRAQADAVSQLAPPSQLFSPESGALAALTPLFTAETHAAVSASPVIPPIAAPAPSVFALPTLIPPVPVAPTLASMPSVPSASPKIPRRELPVVPAAAALSSAASTSEAFALPAKMDLSDAEGGGDVEIVDRSPDESSED